MILGLARAADVRTTKHDACKLLTEGATSPKTPALSRAWRMSKKQFKLFSSRLISTLQLRSITTNARRSFSPENHKPQVLRPGAIRWHYQGHGLGGTVLQQRICPLPCAWRKLCKRMRIVHNSFLVSGWVVTNASLWRPARTKPPSSGAKMPVSDSFTNSEKLSKKPQT